MSAKWKKRSLVFWRDWCRPILVVVVLMGSCRSAVADWHDVPTGSMKPTNLSSPTVAACLSRSRIRPAIPFPRMGRPAAAGAWEPRWVLSSSDGVCSASLNRA